MQLNCKINVAEALRRGHDSQPREVLEFEITELSQDERETLSGYMMGGNFKSTSHDWPELAAPTVQALRERLFELRNRPTSRFPDTTVVLAPNLYTVLSQPRIGALCLSPEDPDVGWRNLWRITGQSDGALDTVLDLEAMDRYNNRSASPLFPPQDPPMTTASDSDRRSFYASHPRHRLDLITDIAGRCYKEWDTWDIGAGPFGVQLAYLFATIANKPGGWSFSLDMSSDEPMPLAPALLAIFPLDHAIWLYIDRQWNDFPESSCPVCAHDCDGRYPKRQCLECGFDEAKHDFRTYKP